MRKLLMQTVELVYTREATHSLVKILDSANVKANIKKLDANAT